MPSDSDGPTKCSAQCCPAMHSHFALRLVFLFPSLFASDLCPSLRAVKTQHTAMADADPSKLVVEQITAATHELMLNEDWQTNLSVSHAINAQPIV